MNTRYAELAATYSTHEREFYAFALSLTKSPARAEDLVSDTMVRAMSAWHQYQEGSNLRAWLFRIMRNSFINDCRKATRHRRYVETVKAQPVDDMPTPDEAVLGKQEYARLSDAIAGLSPKHRQVVELSELREMRYQDVANELGVPIGTVMSRLHRAKRALQATLEPQLRVSMAA